MTWCEILSNERAGIALFKPVLRCQQSTKVHPVAPCNGKLHRCGGSPCSCQASYGWLVPLANELQVAKIAAIETFLDLASFFAREAVFLLFLPSFEAWIATLRCCVASARFD